MILFKSSFHVTWLVICTILCFAYFICSFAMSVMLFRPRGTTISTALCHAHLFSFFISLPFMPFIFGFAPMKLLVFAASNFIWQTIFLNIKHTMKVKDLIIPLSISAMAGWIGMGLTNYWAHGFLQKFMHGLLTKS